MKKYIRLTESDLHRTIEECVRRVLIREFTEDRVIGKDEWEEVLRVMLRYNRRGGYVDEVNGRLRFFDGDPKINGVSAFYVTIDDVQDIINGTYASRDTTFERDDSYDLEANNID